MGLGVARLHPPTSRTMMHIHRMTTPDSSIARDSHVEPSGGQPAAARRGAPRTMDRRSVLGLGVASCAALTTALVRPGSAKAHGGGWGGGCGGTDPKDVVEGLLGALETLDGEEIADWLHQDVIYCNTGMPDICGRDAVAQFIAGFGQVFEPLVVDVVGIMSQGKLVSAARIEHFVVRNDSPIGIPGAEVFLEAAGWFEIKNGKVFRWSDYWDTQVFTSTLGIAL